MSSAKLNLMSRDEFSNLSLHAKNDYLQRMAAQVAGIRGETPTPLDRDALSRLRRFYLRRRMGDLQLDKLPDTDINQALKGLAEAIHLDEVRIIIGHETPSGPKPLTREPPLDDAQLMFFVPQIHDAPIKDDVNLMDVAPFSLSKGVREGVIRYDLKDAVVTVEGGAEVGLATAYDYDIFIHMVSHLAAAMRDYRLAERQGRRGHLPPKTFRPTAAEILKFCRREQGGKQYVDLEKALDRLAATRIRITNLTGGGRRAHQNFPLIGNFRVLSRTAQDKIDQVEINVPDWVYDGVVKPEDKPTILTLNPDYFLIARPLAKFIYRLARKAAGQGEATYGIETVHHRSGSELPLRKFRAQLEQLVEASKTNPLPDYDLEIITRNGVKLLKMINRTKALPTYGEGRP